MITIRVSICNRGGSNKTEYGTKLEFRSRIREFFDWDTEYELDVVLDPDYGSYSELAAEIPGVLLEEDIPGTVAAVETEIIHPKTFPLPLLVIVALQIPQECMMTAMIPPPFLKSTQHNKDLRRNQTQHQRLNLMIIMMMTMMEKRQIKESRNAIRRHTIPNPNIKW